jgi:heat shock protein HspQ
VPGATTPAVTGGATNPAASDPAASETSLFRLARFKIGDVVKHRVFPFRGVVFDVDPVFDNTEEWLASIPEDVRPHKDQPFYHLLAENAETTYVAYVSEQNLLADETGEPCRHPLLREMFSSPKRGLYRMKAMRTN